MEEAYGESLRSQVLFRLPPLIRHSRWALMYLVYWIPFIAIYQVVNRWPVIQPTELPFTWLDRSIPFVPALLPAYVAYLPFYWWTVARSRNDREANWIFYGAHLQLLLSLPFFLLWPIRMPRELFYPPEALNWVDAFWRWFDAPNNCFPSLHVSNCLLLLHFNWFRPYRWLHTLVPVAVIASTVLVKQHYAVDVLGGVTVYLMTRWFLARLEITQMTPDGWVEG